MWFRRPYGVDVEKETATSFSILVWRMPWTEESCRLQSMGSQPGMGNVAVLQALTRDSQCKPLGFWSKTMPLAVENYMRFEEELLACYWALLELEYLIRGLQVTVDSELPIMGWALLDSASHRVEQNQEQSPVRGKWNVWEWGQIGPEGISKDRGQASQTPCHPPPLCQCPSFTHTYGHLCRNLTQPDEKGKRKLGLRGDLAWYANASWKWTAVALWPNSGLALKQSGDKNLNKQSWDRCIWSLTLCERKSSPRWEKIQISGQVPMAQSTIRVHDAPILRRLYHRLSQYWHIMHMKGVAKMAETEAMPGLNSMYAHHWGWFSYWHLGGSKLPATEINLSLPNGIILWGDQPIILWQINHTGPLPCCKTQWFIFLGKHTYLENGFVFLPTESQPTPLCRDLENTWFTGIKSHNTASNQEMHFTVKGGCWWPHSLEAIRFVVYSTTQKQWPSFGSLPKVQLRCHLGDNNLHKMGCLPWGCSIDTKSEKLYDDVSPGGNI